MDRECIIFNIRYSLAMNRMQATLLNRVHGIAGLLMMALGCMIAVFAEFDYFLGVSVIALSAFLFVLKLGNIAALHSDYAKDFMLLYLKRDQMNTEDLTREYQLLHDSSPPEAASLRNAAILNANFWLKINHGVCDHRANDVTISKWQALIALLAGY